MDTDKKATGSKFGTGQITIVGGVGALLSSLLTWQSSDWHPDAISFCQAAIPLLAAAIGALIRYLVKNGEELSSQRKITKAKQRCRNVMDDPKASEELKSKAQALYDSYCFLEMQAEITLELPNQSEKSA